MTTKIVFTRVHPDLDDVVVTYVLPRSRVHFETYAPVDSANREGPAP